jgi:uncharacterized protein (DUF1330 family)
MLVAAGFLAGRASLAESKTRFIEDGVDARCDSPVLMLVLGQIEDREPLRRYSVELAKLSTYPEQQGYYIMGRPFEVFEGIWPEDRLFVVARFPCAAAARGFWFSDDYQGIRDLRAAMGPLSVSLHELRAPPEWISNSEPLRMFGERGTQPNP